jgi:hypothetical protein
MSSVEGWARSPQRKVRWTFPTHEDPLEKLVVKRQVKMALGESWWWTLDAFSRHSSSFPPQIEGGILWIPPSQPFEA